MDEEPISGEMGSEEARGLFDLVALPFLGGPEMRQRKIKFLLEFGKTGNIRQSCYRAGTSRATYLLWKRQDAVFHECFEQASEHATDILEQEATKRAMVGIEKPIFFQGTVVGKVREFSDQLLMFLLKARRPEKYRDRVDVGDSDKNVIDVQVYLPSNGHESAIEVKAIEAPKPDAPAT